MDNVYTLNKIVQGRLREDKWPYYINLYITVWYAGLWLKLWDRANKP